MPATAALSPCEFSALLTAAGGFEARPLVAVAVSGGPDSMALMLLADRWARQRDGQAWGVTVDHRLRPESAAEARIVAAWLAAREIPHRILLWEGEKPASGIQEAARDARYRLLAEWCRAQGCLHLLTAHHREDQAETYLLRRRAGSGVDGLAGMSAVRELAGCRLVRPLLSVPRARLAALLAEAGQPFLEDPSNRNPAFERVRLRRRLEEEPPSASGGQGMIDEAIGEARRCAAERGRREHVLDALIGRAVALHPAGFAVLDPDAIAEADHETVERLLARVAACIGGGRYPARRERLVRLREGLRAASGTRTLGGCRFVTWRGRVLVLRELAAGASPNVLRPGAEVVWDRRFAVALRPTASAAVSVGYLGQSGYRLPPHAEPALPRLLHAVLPAFWDARGLVAVPHLGFRRAGFEPLPSLSLRPANPLTRAGFTVV
jgi:tRNA(Ile)-lysidine synthase